MKFCASCGAALAEGATTCQSCGAAVGGGPVFTQAAANGLIARFWGFEKLIGSALVKVMYYLGLAGLALGVILGLFGALAMLGQSFIGGLAMLIGVLLGAVIGLLIWRFVCEMAILHFQTYNRLGEIRDRLPPAH